MAIFDPTAPVSEPDDPAYEARVLHAFVRGERLVRIPARERKRRVILRFLLDQVLPDEAPVAERDLNQRIARWHPDPASLRRHLVDARLAERASGIYRRAVPVSRRAGPGSAPAGEGSGA
jgi:hypothetical protein